MNTTQRNNIPVGMKPGRRELNEAYLVVGICKTLPIHMQAGVREITSFFVPADKRKQKLGTMLLNLVCQEADVNRLTLMLTASAEDVDGPSDEVLIAWYERFGFIKLQESPTGWIMVRKVHEKPRIEQTNVVDLAVRRAMRNH